jgi:hypothetical protein
MPIDPDGRRIGMDLQKQVQSSSFSLLPENEFNQLKLNQQLECHEGKVFTS